MASIVSSQARWQRPLVPPALVAVALLLVLVLGNPVGYVGGGGDDFYYVEAARCAAAHGWCLPDTHWATRWPLVAPMALVFAALGDGWWQSTLVPLTYGLLAIILFCRLAERIAGYRAATLGGIALVATGALSNAVLIPNIDTVELALVLAAANIGEHAVSRRMRGWAAVAGALLGVALQARMTSLAWLPIAMIVLLYMPPLRRLALAALGGLLVPIGLEAALYGIWAGRPFLSQNLSAAHTRIPSTELSPTVDLSRSPLFNPDFIGGWRPKMGIHVHWAVDGVLNLLWHPQIGPLICAALVFLILRRKSLRWRDPSVIAAGLALIYSGALIYVLAIDPHPRMFLPVAALAAFIVGRAGIELWDGRERLVVGVLTGMLVVFGVTETQKRFDFGVAGPLAHRWASEHRQDVAVEETARRFLTFDPLIRTLPAAPSDARHLLLMSANCWEREPVASKPRQWALLRSHDFGRPNDPLNLCEFSRAQPR